MTTVTITEDPLAFEDFLAIVDGAQVALSDEVRALIESSRAVVDRALVSKAAVYGLTTQVGWSKRQLRRRIRSRMRFTGHCGSAFRRLSASDTRPSGWRVRSQPTAEVRHRERQRAPLGR